LTSIIYKQKQFDINLIPGSGAAGGMGAALAIFMKASFNRVLNW
jgi:glycerate kinase